MESFLKILESHFELTTNFENNSGVGFIQARWRRHLCLSAHVLVTSYFIIVKAKVLKMIRFLSHNNEFFLKLLK